MYWIKIIYQTLIKNLRVRLTRVQFIMLIASVTGLVSGLMAVLLKMLVHYLQEWIEGIPVSRFAYLLFPGLGLLLTVFIIRHFFGGHIDRGISMILRSIARKGSFIPLSHTYLHVLTSSLTVGLGGSVGLEAPILATGSAVGSNVARVSDLNYQERTLLVACGAAAGIAAVFNAPIAGVIFAIEVMLMETIVSYFIPLITASVIGALCSKIILQESILFNFVLQQKFNYYNVPFYILLGLLAGFVSLYYAHTFKKTEGKMHSWNINPYLKAMIGGGILLSVYFVFPPLFGEGYNSIKLLAKGDASALIDNTKLLSLLNTEWAFIIFTGCIVLLKPFAAAITIGSGGNGGNFAPSLFTGSYLGFFFSKLLNTTNLVKIPVDNFCLVGMAGVLSGVMYCPLSAIFLIAEISNGYELFIPLMIVSSISFFIVKSYEPFSMETKKLALEGQIFTHKKEKNILTSIRLEEMLQEQLYTIHQDKQLKDLVKLIKKSKLNIFAIVDDHNKFTGIVELNDIKNKLFELDKYNHLSIRVLIKKPAAILNVDDDMHHVMEQFDKAKTWYLPVLDKNGHFLGFISKTKLFTRYREILSSQTDLYD